jgi:hemerythrin-like domain-containing protein
MAQKKSSASKSDSNKLYHMLKEDHDKVKELFSQIEDKEMDMDSREDVFSEIQSELHEHFEKEEKFFYPPLKEEGETREKALEAYEEHHVAKNVLKEFGKLSVEDEHWMPKIKVLKEIITHHIEEEEKEIFKVASKSLGKEKLDQIGDQIEESMMVKH